jgi:hypothetical protein
LSRVKAVTGPGKLPRRFPLKVAPNVRLPGLRGYAPVVPAFIRLGTKAAGVREHKTTTKENVMTTNKETQTKSTKPAYIAYHVHDSNTVKGMFNRIGVAFPHKDGNGFNLLLDVIPLDGKIIVLRVPTKKTEQSE